jgi:hypothetical protein
VHLLDELRPQAFHWDVDQVLECVFAGKGPNHRHAVTIGKETFQ